MMRSVSEVATALVLAAFATPKACEPAPPIRANVPDVAVPSDDGRRYFTVEEQRRIGRAAIALWTGVDPREDWKPAVDRLFNACGGSFKLEEAFTIASYHPRTTYEWSWRSQVDSLLLGRGTWGWDPSTAPKCKLIREALSEGIPAVQGPKP